MAPHLVPRNHARLIWLGLKKMWKRNWAVWPEYVVRVRPRSAPLARHGNKRSGFVRTDSEYVKKTFTQKTKGAATCKERVLRLTVVKSTRRGERGDLRVSLPVGAGFVMHLLRSARQTQRMTVI